MKWCIEINSEFSEIDRAEAELTIFLSEICNIDDRRLLFILALTFRELVLNSVEHGNQMDKNKKVCCHAKCQGSSIIFDIYDEGKGFENVVDYDDNDVGRERQRGIEILEKMGFVIIVDGNHVKASFNRNKY